MQVIDQSTSAPDVVLVAPATISLTDIRLTGVTDMDPVALELPAVLSWLARAAQHSA